MATFPVQLPFAHNLMREEEKQPREKRGTGEAGRGDKRVCVFSPVTNSIYRSLPFENRLISFDGTAVLICNAICLQARRARMRCMGRFCFLLAVANVSL